MRNKSRTSRPSSMLFHLGALITMIAWGASFVSTKVLLDNGLHPAEIYIYRFLLAYVMILAVSHKRILCNSVRDELLFAVCGLCAGSIYYIAENTALEYTLATNVSLITSLSPILTAIMIGFLYKSERPGRGLVIGSIMAFIGVGLVVFNSSFVINVNPLGDMLSLLAAVSWAIYSILLRRLNATYTVTFIARKTFFYGVLTALPYLLIEPEIASPGLLLRPAVWGNILFLGCFASMLGYIVWAQAIKVLGAVKASNYLYFQPLVTLVVSAWLLGERISWIGYTGCLMILVGVWSSDWLERRAAMRR